MSIIDTFISLHANEAQEKQLTDSIRVLTNAGQVVHTSRIDELLASDSLDSVSSYVIAITEILKDTSESVLREFHINLNTEVFVDLDITTAVIDALIKLPATDQGAAILEIVQDAELDDEERLYKLCSMVVEVDPHSLYLHVDSIGPRLWSRFEEVLSNQNQSLKETSLDETIKNRTKLALEMTKEFQEKDEQGEVDDDVVTYIETTTLGYNLNNALNLLYAGIADRTPQERTAAVWLLISGSSTKDTVKALELVLEKILEPLEIMKVASQISQYSNSTI